MINGGSATTTNPVVSLAISATDALSGTADYRLSESATFADSPAWTAWTGSPQTAPFTLSAGDGSKTVYVQLRDVAGNLSAETDYSHDSISLDQVGPTFTSGVQINGVAPATNDPAVTLTINASDAGSSIADYQLSEDATFVDVTTTTAWTPWTALVGLPQSAPFTLSPGDAAKTVYVRLRDANAHISTPVVDDHDSITLDTAMPTFTSTVLINGGDAATNNPAVSLSIEADDALTGIVEYQLSESSTFAAGPTTTAWTDWTVSPQTAPFTLSSGDALKTVYVRLKDEAGNVSTEAVQNNDSITLDTAVPTFSSTVTINGGDARTTSTGVTLSISATDALSGIDWYRLSESSTFADSPAWTDWTALVGLPQSAPLTLSAGDGSKTVYVQLKDNAGNLSTEATSNHASISLDLAAPVFSSQVLINSGATTTTSTVVTLTIAASDSGSSIAEYQLSESSTFAAGPTTTAWIAWTSTPSYTLSSGDGSKTVYARLKDASGHMSAVDAANNSDSIMLDELAPTFTAAVQINGGDAATNDPDVTVTISATDAGSSISQYQLSEDSTFAPGPTTTAWIAWTPTPSYTLSTGDGSKTIYVRLKDDSGHLSAVDAANNSDSITLDTSAPQILEVRMSDTTDPIPYNVKNAYAFVTFNEDIYGDAVMGPLASDALTVVPQSPSPAVVNSKSTSRSATLTNVAIVTIGWKPTKEPDVGDVIRVETNGATAIYDALGNAMADGIGDTDTAKHLSILLPPASGGAAAAAPASTASGGRRMLPLASMDPIVASPRSAQVPPRPTQRAAPRQATSGVEPLAQFHRPVAVAAAPKAEPRDPASPQPRVAAESVDSGAPIVAASGASTAAPAARTSRASATSSIAM
ncbi:MAG: hypothetical protein IMZ65_00705, partial [Planctomycetes bacterium]|nr:hypothetical protein [Planctomycetota bacterium]